MLMRTGLLRRCLVSQSLRRLQSTVSTAVPEAVESAASKLGSTVTSSGPEVVETATATAKAGPSMFERVNKFVWSDPVFYPATLGFIAYCAYFIYNYEQGSTLPPSPVNYADKVSEAKELVEREQRAKLIRRVATAQLTMSAHKASGKVTDADKEELEQALKALSKIKGGEAALAELQKVLGKAPEVDESTLQERVGEALIDAVSGKHTFNEWAGVRSATGDMTGKANLKEWM